MKKALLISLGYIIVSGVINYSTFLMFDLFLKNNYNVHVVANNISFFLSLIVFMYLIIAVYKRIHIYPSLIAFIVLVSLSKFVGLLRALLTNLGGFGFMVQLPLLALAFSIMLAGIVIGVVMMKRKSWPLIVSIVIFIQAIGTLLDVGFFVNIAYGYVGTSMFGDIAVIYPFFRISTVLLLSVMLFVLYYNKEEFEEPMYLYD